METNLIRLAGGPVAARFVSYYRYEYYQFNAVDRVIGGHARSTICHRRVTKESNASNNRRKQR